MKSLLTLLTEVKFFYKIFRSKALRTNLPSLLGTLRAGPLRLNKTNVEYLSHPVHSGEVDNNKLNVDGDD